MRPLLEKECGAESVSSLFAAMLKQVQQMENNTYVSVKTAREPVSRKVNMHALVF